MLKNYKDYLLKEARKEDIAVGDKVIYKSSNFKPQFKQYDGFECDVVRDYKNGTFSIKLPEPHYYISAEASELTKVESKKEDSATYVEKQFEIKPGEKGGLMITNSKKDDYVLGQRVEVNGTIGREKFEHRKGTVKRITPNDLLISFDEDESKNLRSVTFLVSKTITTPIDEPNALPIQLKVDDKVKCIDSFSKFYNKIGRVSRVWTDGQAMVEFKTSETSTTVDGMVMDADQVKVVEYSKDAPSNDFKTIPVSSKEAKKPENNAIEEEEEDEDGTGVTINKRESMKKSDLLEISYIDFFDENKLSTKEDLSANKIKFEKYLENKDLPELKLNFYERSLGTIEIIEQYFDFLTTKIAKDVPVYRTTENIESEELLKLKTKVRASESKEITKKYSFDQGIIAYWKFKDAVIFKTI